MSIGLTIGLGAIQNGNRVNDLSVIARAKDPVSIGNYLYIFSFQRAYGNSCLNYANEILLVC